jgi:AcrR family transcriptional regulator
MQTIMVSRKDTPAKRRIRSAAISLFKRRGEAGVTMRTIANAADVSAASLYRHYPSRSALLADVFRSIVSLLERQLANLDAELHPSKRTYEAFLSYFDWGLQYPEVFDLGFARHLNSSSDVSDDVHVLRQSLGESLPREFDALLALTVGAAILFHTRPTEETAEEARGRYSELLHKTISA